MAYAPALDLTTLFEVICQGRQNGQSHVGHHHRMIWTDDRIMDPDHAVREPCERLYLCPTDTASMTSMTLFMV